MFKPRLTHRPVFGAGFPFTKDYKQKGKRLICFLSETSGLSWRLLERCKGGSADLAFIQERKLADERVKTLAATVGPSLLKLSQVARK